MNAENWRYDIQHGPDGEANYAWVYRGQNMVATMKTHDAKAICDRMNTPNPAVNVGAVVKSGREIIARFLAERMAASPMAGSLTTDDYMGFGGAHTQAELLIQRLSLSALTSPQGEETPAAPSPHVDVTGSWQREHVALGELIRLLDEEPSIGDAEMADALEKARCAWDHSHVPSPQPLSPTLKAPDRDGGGE